MSEAVETGRGPSPLKRALRALEDMQGRLEAAERATREPIAIIGMGCRLPGGAETPEEFWDVLREGRDCVGEIPPDRFDVDRYYDPRPGIPGKTNTRYGAFLKNIRDFDPGFAGVAPKNAYSVDPQQRLLGATAWEALESAGIAPLSLEGSRTGVYVGIWSVDYWQRLNARPPEELDANVIGGNTHSVASGAISYLLGLRGPSLSVDTACSSSLVTVDLACQGLRTGACDLALAGGVNVVLGPENYVCLSATQVLAPDGRCKTFDASADGFSRGEGCGMVVLKRLSEARRDRDPILAVILGSCVNQDGKTAGITVPNGPSQEDAARRALAQGGVRPTDVGFVEAHGTGTSLGDPIEVGALGNVYGEGRPREQPLLVGSVKSNIGHLESAAGVAGLIKAVLCLRNEAIPPNLHFRTPNPAIRWDEMPLRVVTELTPWPRGSRPRYAAVSSFGASGTNAHLVLGEAPPVASPEGRRPERSRHVLTLSAKTKDALERAVPRLEDHLARHPELTAGDVCFTANVGRSPFRERLAVVAASAEDLREQLGAVRQGRPTSAVARGRVKGAARPRLTFAFTGQGAQQIGMGRGLYETQPVFRETLDRCDGILRPLLGGSLVDVIFPSKDGASPLDETTWTQPALFAFEYALATLWRSWGVEPSVVLGHSVGEYVAACLAGVFGLEDGLKLIATRARLMGALPREGAMVAVLAGEARVQEAVAAHARDVSIAALNGPENVVVSGREETVAALAAAFEAQGVETRRLNVSHAFHSPLMERMLAEFERTVREVAFAAPGLTLVSNLTGAPAGAEVALPEYWVSHVRQPVRFADAVRAAHEQGSDVFLEVGPRPVLSGMGAGCLPPGAATWLPSLRPGQGDEERVLLSLGELWVRGVPVDWAAFDEGHGRSRVALPTYPFRGEEYWIETPAPRPLAANGDWLKALLEARESGRIEETIRGAGQFSADEARLLARLLDVFTDEYRRRTAGAPSLVAEYYNAIPSAARHLEGGSQEEQAERYLTFGPFHEPLEGFSWVRTFAEPTRHPEWARLCFEAQKEMREELFRGIDFAACRSALDFGCGYGSDLVALAQRHAHLELTGYTIAGEQARIGQAKVEALGLGDRVRILNRDSARDDFPGEYDLVFGFEVAHHVANKRALFANIGRHLRDGGHLVLADFISRTGFAIDHEATSSYFITRDEWSELLAENHLEVVRGVDISQEIANFLHDPHFDENLAATEAFRADPTIRAGFKSYDQLGRLLRQGLADYVLLRSRRRPDLAVGELGRRNRESLDRLTPYGQVALAGSCYEVGWAPREKAAPPAGGRRGGRVLVLADEGGVAEALAPPLETDGTRVLLARAGTAFGRDGEGRWTVDPRRREDLERLLEEAGGPASLRDVVHLWPLDVPSSADLTAETLRRAQEVGTEAALLLVQLLAGSAAAEKPRLWLVTRRALAAGGAPPEIASAPLAGLAKSILLEHPEVWGGMVDLDAGDAAEAARVLAPELAAPEGEFHVAWREGRRLVARLERRRRPEPGRPPVRAEASYLVTGGLGALGRRVARWLVDQGARHLVLAGRHDPGAAARASLAELEAAGARVVVVRADVASGEDVARLMETVDSLPPLRGVVHAAGVLDDGVLLQQTPERFRAVMAPKVLGGFHLDRATAGRELDFFVLFSSAAALLGSAGQGNYSAANAFLDALAQSRRARALPALSVAWGAWAETGMAAAMTAAQRQALAERGVGDIDPADGLGLLGDLIAEGRAQVGVCPMGWTRFFAGVSTERVLPYLERVAPRVAPAAEPAGDGDIQARIAEAPGEERRDLLMAWLQEKVGRVLGHPNPAALDRELTLLELGFDSLMAVQLRNALRSGLAVDVPVGRLFDSASVESLAAMVDEKLALEALHAPPRGEPGTAGDVHVEVI